MKLVEAMVKRVEVLLLQNLQRGVLPGDFLYSCSRSIGLANITRDALVFINLHPRWRGHEQ